MKKTIVLLLIFIISCHVVFAAGKTEAAAKPPVNPNWILCITNLDSSALPEHRRSVVDIFMRSLADKILTVKYRLRVSSEYAYYEDYAWSRDITAAAKALEAKQNERALLLYQGEPEWKYRQNVKKRDTEIAKLQETLDAKLAERPNVSLKPDFNLTTGNKAGTFPDAPKSGGEYRFCQSQNADGFLSGTITEFYGRYYVSLKLYVQYTRSIIYEDDVIFSAESVDEAVNEIAEKLTMVLSGNKPAAIAVHADPPETLILINHAFAGRGSVETTELPPGKVTVAFSRDDYNSEIVETELVPGELTELTVNLSPHVKGEVEITAPEEANASVYQGALFMGSIPLSLWMPLSQLDYINILTPNGREARAVYYTPENVNEGITLSLKTIIPPTKGQRRVNNARSKYYWSWGGTWISGIAAWVTSGIYTGYNESYQSTNNPALAQPANIMMYVSYGTLGLTLAVVVYHIYRLVVYLQTSTESAIPIVKPQMRTQPPPQARTEPPPQPELRSDPESQPELRTETNK